MADVPGGSCCFPCVVVAFRVCVLACAMLANMLWLAGMCNVGNAISQAS